MLVPIGILGRLPITPLTEQSKDDILAWSTTHLVFFLCKFLT